MRLIEDEALGAAVFAIQEEIARSIKIHPVYPMDNLRRTAVMVEEAGEALKEAVSMTAPGTSPDLVEYHRVRLFDELTQTAAMCIRQMVALAAERRSNET